MGGPRLEGQGGNDFAKRIQRETVLYVLFHMISKNKWGFRDMSRAMEALEFEAQDAAEAFRQPLP